LLTTTSTDRISRARQRLEAKLINRLGFEGYHQLAPQLRELENAVRCMKGQVEKPQIDTTPKHVCPEPAWDVHPITWRKMRGGN